MTRKRILIVEDETLIAADLAGRLEKLGYEVSGIATGGAEALSTAAENPPDAVLMDITLSDEMNGIDAAAELHGRRGIPVIYLTAHADIPTLTRARETEPHGILLKPIRDIDLMSALETAIQRHSLEVRLRASEEKYRRMVEGISDVIYEVGVEGTISYISPAITAILGHSPEEITGENFLRFFHQDDLARLKMDFDRSLAGNTRPDEYRVIARDGSIRWVRIFDTPVRTEEGVIGLRGVLTDITDIMDARESMRRSEERYRILSEISTDAASSLRLNPDGCFEREWSAGRFIETMGYALDRLDSFEKWLTIVHPDDIHLFKNALPGLMQGHVKTVEARVYAADGSLKWIRDTVFPYWDEKEGRVVRLVSAVQDITARKEAEQSLEDEKLRLATTIRDIADGIITVDRGGSITLFNPAAEAITGWTFGEAAGKSPADIFRLYQAETEEVIPDLFEGLLEGKEGNAALRRARLVARDGAEKQIEFSTTALHERFDLPAGAVLVMRDITGRMKLENELQKARKLESVGELAGGIAHDFNNMLTTVLGNVSLAKMHTEERAEARRYLENAERAIAQARELTQQLLTFARGGEPIKERIDIAGLVREAASICLDGRGVLCEFDMPDDLGDIMADRGQMRQVIQNLAINAEQAMPEGGKVRFSATRAVIGPGSGLPIPSGEYILLIVEDSGVGIPKTLRERVFDPYFSTKQKGSGLGLSIVYSIVKKHGGTILLDSEVGAGTRFHVYLPALISEESNERRKARR